jgi:hypothetical protein
MDRQILGVVGFFVVLILYMVTARFTTKAISRKWNVSPKLVEYMLVIIVFVVCSYLAIFTNVYRRISEFTGIPFR